MRAAAILLFALSSAPGVSAPRAEEAGLHAEVYVAELDGDWNVAREVRLRCEPARGCAAELDGPTRVRVRFAPLGDGAVAVSSRLEDAAGHSLPQPELTLALDGRGFAVGRIETGASGGEPRILMLAVQAPGLVAPGARAITGDRI